MPAFDAGALRQQLTDRLGAAMEGLRGELGTEHLYAVALVVSGEERYAWVEAAANTEEALARRAAALAAEDPRYAGDAGRRLLRWQPEQWGWPDFAPAVRALALPALATRTAAQDAAIHDALVGALRTLDRGGRFGRGADRCFLTLLVTCPRASKRFFLKGLRLLNPRPVWDRHARESVPEPLVRCINRAPRRERLRLWLALYEDLLMEWTTPIAEEARARGMSPWDVEEQLVKHGAKAVPHLLDLVSHYGFASAFDKARGLETREVWLAGSALFLVRRIGLVTERDVARLQALVARFVERDRRLRVASTLAENTARVLHELRPRRFPPTEMHPNTFKLLNPEPYLPPGTSPARQAVR
ncbi:MAG TPA: DUF4303 domain-containing protein [Anaeromyxobacteraceae bacterium]|nr:DUF4303 domain-containing protein [Anaeromyxobacteraceae bacterium]